MTLPRTLSHLLAPAACFVFLALPASAQVLQLADLQQAAIADDPRTRQVALLESQSALRSRNISALRLPALRG